MTVPSCPVPDLICQDCVVPMEIIVSRAVCPSCGRREFDRLTCHWPATETAIVDGVETQRCPAHAAATRSSGA